MLYAVATREFWRHVISILVAVIVGSVALIILSFKPVIIAFLVLLTATFLSWFWTIIKRPVATTAGAFNHARLMFGLAFGYLILCGSAFYKPGQMFLSYPLICAFVTSLFPGEFSIAGRLRAWEHGTIHCFKALLIGLAVSCVLLLIVDQGSSYFKVRETQKTPLLVIAVGVAMVPTHYIYTREIFQLISIVELGL